MSTPTSASSYGYHGEMPDADAVGTAGSPGCGDMLRVWLKFREEKERGRVIDQASFQSFGCETAMAVADVAMRMLSGKTIEEARALGGDDLSAPLGPLPPMKIHCAGLVEQALQQALNASECPMLSAKTKTEEHSLDPTPEGLQATIRQAQSGGKTIKFIQAGS